MEATLEAPKRGGLETIKPSIRENPAPPELRAGKDAIRKAVQCVLTLISWFAFKNKNNQLQHLVRDRWIPLSGTITSPEQFAEGMKKDILAYVHTIEQGRDLPRSFHVTDDFLRNHLDEDCPNRCCSLARKIVTGKTLQSVAKDLGKRLQNSEDFRVILDEAVGE